MVCARCVWDSHYPKCDKYAICIAVYIVHMCHAHKTVAQKKRTVDICVQAAPAQSVLITSTDVPKLKKNFAPLFSTVNLQNTEIIKQIRWSKNMCGTNLDVSVASYSKWWVAVVCRLAEKVDYAGFSDALNAYACALRDLGLNKKEIQNPQTRVSKH